MTKPLDKTLEAIQSLDDAIVDVKTQRNVMIDELAISDYDKILTYLESASESLVNAILLFQKYKKPL